VGLHIYPSSSFSLRESNDCHAPGGSPAGGQFCSTGVQLGYIPSRTRPGEEDKPIIRQKGRTVVVPDHVKGRLDQIARDKGIPDDAKAKRMLEVLERQLPSLVEGAEDMVARGRIAHKEFVEVAEQLGKAHGYQVSRADIPGGPTMDRPQAMLGNDAIYAVVGGVKGITRVAVKATTDYDGDLGQVKDIVRGSIVVNTVEEATEAIRRLGTMEGVQVVTDSLKDKMNNPLESGYADASLLIRLPKSGMLAEIQIITKPMLEAKQVKGGHKLYEAWRLQPKDSPRAKQLEAQMRELYGEAWRQSQASPEALKALDALIRQGRARGTRLNPLLPKEGLVRRRAN
jgi:hypothetical protein